MTKKTKFELELSGIIDFVSTTERERVIDMIQQGLVQTLQRLTDELPDHLVPNRWVAELKATTVDDEVDDDDDGVGNALLGTIGNAMADRTMKWMREKPLAGCKCPICSTMRNELGDDTMRDMVEAWERGDDMAYLLNGSEWGEALKSALFKARMASDMADIVSMN